MAAIKETTIVIIPSYNEGRTIGSIVRDIVAIGFNVLVIDDGSSDNTQKEALDNGAMVIRNKENIGKGRSIREGFKYVIGKMNYEWIVLMDGDGQHDPEDIMVLTNATLTSDAELVLGSRMTYTKNMPFVRHMTNKFMSWIISCISKQRIPDSQCGFRLLSVKALQGLELTSTKYDIESELIIEAARSGNKIISVPVKTIYGDEVSEINPVEDAIRFFSLIFKYVFKKNGSQRTKRENGK